jgi:hypothetical protein
VEVGNAKTGPRRAGKLKLYVKVASVNYKALVGAHDKAAAQQWRLLQRTQKPAAQQAGSG